MLPFDHRGFVFGYVLVLGAHTLVTKTLLVWALFFAAASWRIGEIALAVLCGCMSCVVTAAGYRMCRRGHAVLPLLWAAGILAAILLLRQWAAVLSAAAVSAIAAVLYLAFADAYDFCSAGVAKKACPAYRPHRERLHLPVALFDGEQDIPYQHCGPGPRSPVFYRCCLVKFKA